MKYKLVESGGSVKIFNNGELVIDVHHVYTGDYKKLVERTQKIVDVGNEFYIDHGHMVELSTYGTTKKLYGDALVKITIDNDNIVSVNKSPLCDCGVHAKDDCPCYGSACDECDGCFRCYTCTCN